MGIPGLIAFLRKKAPLAFKRATADDLHGKTIGIDLSITLYRGAATAYKNGALSHLETLAREVGWLLSHGCKPVYVIENGPPRNTSRSCSLDLRRLHKTAHSSKPFRNCNDSVFVSPLR